MFLRELLFSVFNSTEVKDLTSEVKSSNFPITRAWHDGGVSSLWPRRVCVFLFNLQTLLRTRRWHGVERRGSAFPQWLQVPWWVSGCLEYPRSSACSSFLARPDFVSILSTPKPPILLHFFAPFAYAAGCCHGGLLTYFFFQFVFVYRMSTQKNPLIDSLITDR